MKISFQKITIIATVMLAQAARSLYVIEEKPEYCSLASEKTIEISNEHFLDYMEVVVYGYEHANNGKDLYSFEIYLGRVEAGSKGFFQVVTTFDSFFIKVLGPKFKRNLLINPYVSCYNMYSSSAGQFLPVRI